MQKFIVPFFYAIALVAVLAVAAFNQQPDPPPLIRTGAMTLPANYRSEFVQYLTVERIDNTVRKLYIHPSALERIRAGQELPDGTQLIIETYEKLPSDDDELLTGDLTMNIHMSEKRSTWRREELATAGTDVHWNFASFDPETGLPTDENRNDCFTCHDANAFRQDFAISRQVIDAFIQSGGEVRYLYCPRTGRASCL